MKRPKILLVDDKKANIYALRQILESEDIDMLEAHNGQECLRTLLEEDIDLILLDIRMPKISGFECATLIRDNVKTNTIPIIFVTAADRNEKIHLEGYQHGAIDIIYKPINPHVLKLKVGLLLEMVQTKRELKAQVDLLTELNTENKAMQHKIEQIAMYDYLTGVPNRRKIDMDYHKIYLNAFREQKPIAVMIADLDNFKGYNDFYGHIAGDNVLQSVAHGIQSCLKRSMDFVGRFGGEEFMIVLHNTDTAGAETVAKTILKKIESLQIKHCPKCNKPYVTISIGICSGVPKRYNDEISMVELCDQALYEAKNEGKNTYKIKKAD